MSTAIEYVEPSHQRQPIPLLAALQRSREPLYAQLDAARDDAILPLLHTGTIAPIALLQDTKAAEVASFGPHLVLLTGNEGLIVQLVHRGWGRSWGLYFNSAAPLRELVAHLRTHCWAATPDGRRRYFRYYDPRVARTFLPALSENDLSDFLGPISSLSFEAEDPGAMDCWARTAVGVQRHRLTVVTHGGPASRA